MAYCMLQNANFHLLRREFNFFLTKFSDHNNKHQTKSTGNQNSFCADTARMWKTEKTKEKRSANGQIRCTTIGPTIDNCKTQTQTQFTFTDYVADLNEMPPVLIRCKRSALKCQLHQWCCNGTQIHSINASVPVAQLVSATTTKTLTMFCQL